MAQTRTASSVTDIEQCCPLKSGRISRTDRASLAALLGGGHVRQLMDPVLRDDVAVDKLEIILWHEAKHAIGVLNVGAVKSELAPARRAASAPNRPVRRGRP
jgi:hypothetical protein